MALFLETMEKGCKIEVNDKIVHLTLLRVKNKFANGGKTEPSRFRNILTNIILEYDGRSAFTELQLHHRAIREYNEASHAHDHYDYFRSLLAGTTFDQDLDAMLDRTITFIEEVKGVPVLLSMLVLIFKNRQAGSNEPLPASRYELYEICLLYTSPSPRDATLSRMPSSA